MANINKRKALLSVLIPTKNRAEYALYAINSVLKLKRADIEIVIQDCSDTDSLRQLINQDSDRLRYFYDEGNPSMTQNWDNAISNSNGKYVLGIGDDDCVLSNVMDVVSWMEDKKVDCVRQPMTVYMWPDDKNRYALGEILTFSKCFNGSIEKVDIDREYKKQVRDCGFGYTENLPNLYHAIITRKILNLHKSKTGCFLNSVSLDSYASFAYADSVSNMYNVNYPFSIHGVSPKSNSSRSLKNNLDELALKHFKDFKNLTVYESLPNIKSSEVAITESLLCALYDTKREEMIGTINYAILYGKCAALNISSVFYLYKKYRVIKNENFNNIEFIKYFIHFSKARIISKSINLIIQLIPLYLYIFLTKRLGRSFKYKASNIDYAKQQIEEYLIDKGVKLQD
jgi:glycosyltransferase involved in cell wall biosynthesis